MVGALIWLAALGLIIIILFIVLTQMTCSYRARVLDNKYNNSASRATTLENQRNMGVHKAGEVGGTMKTTVGSDIGLEETTPYWPKEEFDDEGVEETAAGGEVGGSRMQFGEEDEAPRDLPTDYTADMTASNEMFFHNDTTLKNNSLRSKDPSYLETYKTNDISDGYDY